MASAKKLPSGSWRVNLYIGKDSDGKRKYKSFTADTRKEAEYLAAQYNQLHIDINRSELPLGSAIDEYISSKENILSPSTVKGYKVIRNQYLPQLMATKVKDIDQELIQKHFNDFAKDYSPKTCRSAHGLISVVLKIHRPELVLRTTLPQKKKKSIYVPDNAEIAEMYSLIIGTALEVPFLLATQCGLRASEISGLELDCVFENYIRIKQARVEGEHGAVLKDPKSLAGYRDIPISKSLYDTLIRKAEGNRVCNITSNSVSSRWTNFRDKHKINKACNFHALRHHYASKCLLLGMPQKYTAELMGHSSLDMIEKVYQHTFPSAMEQYAKKLREMNEEFMQHEMQHNK